MQIDEWVVAYQASTNVFIILAESVDSSDLDRRHPQGWSARQVIHHMADSETQSYARLRRLLAEPAGAAIQGYDEDSWARAEILGYEVLPVQHSIEVTKAVRASSLDLITRMSESDLLRYGIHSESGQYSALTWLDIYTQHPLDHADQLRRALIGAL